MNKGYPDWNVFKAKAQGASRERFEDLCRLLFCEEFGISQGSLEAVKNQAGNETELVYCRDNNIGFQSKFFDYKLNLQKFKDSIAKAKKYNPTQDVIYLYSNVEFSSEKEKEKLKACVEKHKMKCELRFGKQILDKVVSCKNELIYETFFCLDSNIGDVLKYGIERTSSYLDDIQTIISFKDCDVVVDRQKEMRWLGEVLSNNRIALVVGHGGCGKSSLTKMYIETLEKDGVGVRIYRGERFNERNINDMLVCEHGLFFEAYDVYDEKYFIIDSAEQIVLRKHPDELSLLFRMLRNHHWLLILTCRIEAAGMLLDFIHYKTEQTVETVEVNRLTEKQLEELSNNYGFTLPTDHLLRDFIRVPMELKEYLSQNSERSQLSFVEFKIKEWKERICGTDGELDAKSKERELFVLELAKALFVDDEKQLLSQLQAKEEIVKELREDHVLVSNDNGKTLRFSHDLYGEWAVTELLDRSYMDNGSIERLYKEYGKTVTGCRCLRQWISDKIGKDAEINKVVCELLRNKCDGRLEGELITAVLQSEEVNSFVTNNRELLLVGNLRILKRMLFWLPVSCVYVSRDELLGTSSASVDPNGKGWEAVIDFVFNLDKKYWVELYYYILPVISLWSKSRAEGTTVRQCGETALELLSSNSGTPLKLPYYRLIPVIFRAVGEIGTALGKYIRNILRNKHISGDSLERYVLEYAVKESDIGNYRFTQNNPQLMTEIWDYCWHGGHINVERYGSFGDYYSFGLDRSFSIYVTDGRFQTSLAYMLLANPRFVLDYLIEFMNKAVACYMEKTPQIHYDEIVIKLQGVTVSQWGNEELWCAYRKGIMSNVPDLIASLLVDLQWYLDYVVGRGTVDCDFMRSLIMKSKNVMITAVVTAVALKYLDKYRDFVDELAKSERLTALDKHRWEVEYDSFEVGMPNNASVRIGLYERNLQLKENAYKIQKISLANYAIGDIRRPVSFYDAILSDETMGPTRWILLFFEKKKGSREEGQKMVREARDELDKNEGISLGSQISMSSIDGIAPAYIQLCDKVDDDVRWCKDFVLHILNESHALYNPAALYDGLAYCINSTPQLLRLFPEERSTILDSVLAVCLNVKDRFYKPPIDELIVEMIRKGRLWESYRSEMEKMIGKFVSLCKIRSGKLRPVEISLALRMLPEQDLGFKFSLLKMKLAKQLIRYGEKDIHGNYISPRQLSEPVAEILLCNHSWWIRFYTEKLLMKSIIHNRVSEVYLAGLIHEMEISRNVDRFYALWTRLARKVYKYKNVDYRINRQKEILTFQDSVDIINRMKENQDFIKKNLQYMRLLVSRCDNDKNILKGLMMFAEYSGEEYLEDWFSLIYRSLLNMESRIISYAGLSQLEDVMRRCQSLLEYGDTSSKSSVVRAKMIGVLDKMIDCGSSKAYVMKEYYE